jgi:hypothetical protein
MSAQLPRAGPFYLLRAVQLSSDMCRDAAFQLFECARSNFNGPLVFLCGSFPLKRWSVRGDMLCVASFLRSLKSRFEIDHVVPPI